ncbi:MAG: hypothetical protein KatS3mg087_1086 [Patescibacteria group bacterium]|nr:MAG: hypothetical protein KatS3mg087_1086 [Patescibacteria group bacterium]
MTNAKLISLVREAQQSFCGWDWPQDFHCRCCGRTIVIDGADYPRYCCASMQSQVEEYAAEAERVALMARQYGDQAIRALARGKLYAAREWLQRAVSLEREYGDAPAYGPVLAAIEARLARNRS